MYACDDTCHAEKKTEIKVARIGRNVAAAQAEQLAAAMAWLAAISGAHRSRQYQHKRQQRQPALARKSSLAGGIAASRKRGWRAAASRGSIMAKTQKPGIGEKIIENNIVKLAKRQL